MFAVVRTGGKQYRVHPGDKIVVEKLGGNAGDRVTLGDVLLAGEGSNFRNAQGLTVDAEIVAQAKGEKVTVFKKRRRHNYRRKKGHRQQHTILKIIAIGGEKAPKKTAPSKAEASPVATGDASSKPKAKSAPAEKPSAAPAEVDATPTENPAPQNEAQANPAPESTDAPPKASKAPSKDKPTAKTPSTKNAAPAKGAAKKAPKAK